MLKFRQRFFSSSVVERSAVNRLVVGSNPTWGDFLISNFFCFASIANWLELAFISTSFWAGRAPTVGTKQRKGTVLLPRKEKEKNSSSFGKKKQSRVVIIAKTHSYEVRFLINSHLSNKSK